MPEDPKFRLLTSKARAMFLREMRDGCPDCQEVPQPHGFCEAHRRQAEDVIVRPRSVPEFQEFLRATVR